MLARDMSEGCEESLTTTKMLEGAAVETITSAGGIALATVTFERGRLF